MDAAAAAGVVAGADGADAVVTGDAAAVRHDRDGDRRYGDNRYDGNNDHGGSNDHDAVHSMQHADAEGGADGAASADVVDEVAVLQLPVQKICTRI
jgi:hypothetical protein